jgi:hypothetical protein
VEVVAKIRSRCCCACCGTDASLAIISRKSKINVEWHYTLLLLSVAKLGRGFKFTKSFSTLSVVSLLPGGLESTDGICGNGKNVLDADEAPSALFRQTQRSSPTTRVDDEAFEGEAGNGFSAFSVLRRKKRDAVGVSRDSGGWAGSLHFLFKP